MPGTLYIVATPIGNLEDITLRALRVLKEAGLIAAEDTRQTQKLLTHFGIHTRLTSYHEHNEREKAPAILEELTSGVDVALVSDAGTPGISDPGYRLVRLSIENSIRVVPVPGASAAICALSVAGFPIDEFTFKGFIPATASQRKKFLLGLKAPEHTFVVYEAARRLEAALGDIIGVIGDVDVAVARELTKVHEEVLRGKASKVLEGIRGRVLKGEITLVVRTSGAQEAQIDPREELERLLASGMRIKDAVKAVAQASGLAGGELYKLALTLKGRLRQ